MSEKKGVIYILTNPSFENYVKIGYADDVDRRLKELNRSECIPFAFRIYATYEVDDRLMDRKVHKIIDKLNIGLRSVEEYNGHRREREFYAMTPEDAYSIFEAMAEIHNCTERLKKYTPTDKELKDEEVAQSVKDESIARSEVFTFSAVQIPVGAVLEYVNDSNITCKVVDDRKIEYEGECMYLTTLAKRLLGKPTGVAGPRYFKYKGAKLWDIEGRTE